MIQKIIFDQTTFSVCNKKLVVIHSCFVKSIPKAIFEKKCFDGAAFCAFANKPQNPHVRGHKSPLNLGLYYYDLGPIDMRLAAAVSTLYIVNVTNK